MPAEDWENSLLSFLDLNSGGFASVSSKNSSQIISLLERAKQVCINFSYLVMAVCFSLDLE
jgi:hypothetical protein